MTQSNKNKYELDFTSGGGGIFNSTNQESLMVCADQLLFEKISLEHSSTDEYYRASLL